MRDFVVFLREHHLDELAAVNLRRIRALNVPLMAMFDGLPEDQLLAMTRASLERFLTDLEQGRALETSAASLRQWETDELPGLSRDAIQPTDLVLVGAAQKATIVEFLTRFTRDPERLMTVLMELEDFYMRSQANAFQVFTRVREQAAGSAAREETALATATADRIQALNDALTVQKAEAQEANRLKSEFLANMSHELRTPLNSILGYTNLVLKNKKVPIDDVHRENLMVVQKNGKHLLALINDVLDLAKVEAGRATVFVELLDPTSLFHGIVGTATPLAREKGLTLSLDLDEKLGPLLSDETKVRQIILNLVSNAIKFTPSGGVTVRVKGVGEDRWSVEVADTGVGIAPEDQQLVFEEFRQVDASPTRAAGGTGLGLAIARKMAQLLGGDLSLQSELGRGSTFRLELPRVADGERFPELTTRTVVPRVEVSQPLPDGRLAVVAIDDDPEMLHLIAERLKDSPYVAVPASTGESGLRLVRELKPFAVTLDIILPTKDGWSILRELKNDPETADIPVLIMSVADSKVLGYALGAAGYLTKPVDHGELLAALDRFAGGARQGRGYVLVIDDEEEARTLYRDALAVDGMRLVEAADGRQGIQAIEAEVPALVVLDLMMPGMDGFEVLAWLRSRPATRQVPVIVVTARDLTDADRQRLSLAQGVFCKTELTGATLVEELRVLSAASDAVSGGAR